MAEGSDGTACAPKAVRQTVEADDVAAVQALPPVAVCLQQPACLPIGIATMPYRADVHDTLTVIDRINHAIVTNADTPEVLRSLKLYTAMRSRVRSESFDTREDAV